MMQNLLGLLRIDVGVETANLTQTAFDLRRREDDEAKRLLLLGQLEEKLASSSGVQAALVSNAPLAGATVRRLHIEGQAASEPGNLPQVSLINIGQRYFDVVGATTIAGRTLTTDVCVRPLTLRSSTSDLPVCTSRTA